MDVERVFAPDSEEGAVTDVIVRFASGAVVAQLLGLLLDQGVHDVLQLHRPGIVDKFPHLNSCLVPDAVVVGYNLRVKV